MKLIDNLLLRLSLFAFYVLLGLLSLFAPDRGRRLVDDAHAGQRANKLGLRL